MSYILQFSGVRSNTSNADYYHQPPMRSKNNWHLSVILQWLHAQLWPLGRPSVGESLHLPQRLPRGRRSGKTCSSSPQSCGCITGDLAGTTPHTHMDDHRASTAARRDRFNGFAQLSWQSLMCRPLDVCLAAVSRVHAWMRWEKISRAFLEYRGFCFDGFLSMTHSELEKCFTNMVNTCRDLSPGR